MKPDDMIEFTIKCRECKKNHIIKAKRKDINEYIGPSSRLIQCIFPYLKPAERELLITGACRECVKKRIEQVRLYECI